MVNTGGLELPHVAVHPAYDLIVVFFIDLRILHVPSGQLLGKDLVEDIVLIECDGFVNAAVAVGFGRNIGIIPFLHKDVHAVIPAQTEKLAFQIIVGSKPVLTPGGVQDPVSDVYKIQQMPEFLI